MTPNPNTAQPLHTPIPFLHVAFTPNGVRLFDEHGAAWLAIPEMGSDDKEESVARFAVSAVNAHAANEAKIAALVKALVHADSEMRYAVAAFNNDANPTAAKKGLGESLVIARAALALART